MDQINPHVTSLHVDLKWFPQPYPPNVYLIHDGREAALIDSGFSDDDSFKARQEFLTARPDLKLRYIVLTHHHYDHASGAHRLREATGAKVVVHRDEERLLLSPESESGDFEIPEDQKEAREQAKKWRAEAAKAVPDLRVDDGAQLRIGELTLRCAHTPGHTAGHLCLLLEEERMLFAGDNVIGVGTSVVEDMAEYLRSLKKMQALESELMAPGHGPIVKDPHRKLQELIDHRGQREEQILSLLAAGKLDVKSLVKAIYPELDKRLLLMANGQVLAHLRKLQADGRVRLEGKGAETAVTPL